jgi:hypothetical protein
MGWTRRGRTRKVFNFAICSFVPLSTHQGYERWNERQKWAKMPIKQGVLGGTKQDRKKAVRFSLDSGRQTGAGSFRGEGNREGGAFSILTDKYYDNQEPAPSLKRICPYPAMTLGRYPAAVMPGEDHATRILVDLGWLQKQGEIGASVDPITRERVQQHMALHW